MKEGRMDLRGEVKAGKQDAWDVLMNPPDWVNSLASQPTMGIVSHHDESRNIVANVTTSLTEPVEQPRRKVKKKVQEGVRKVKRIPATE